MEWISYLVLILLTLVAYSGGAVGKAGKAVELKPSLADLFLVPALWTGAVITRASLELNKWLIVLIWMVAAALVGIISGWVRKPGRKKAEVAKPRENGGIFKLKGLLAQWAGFSKRLGAFQGRILLSFLYFLVVSPFAIGVRLLGDPLKIKHRERASYWHVREETESGMTGMRRQF